MEQLPLWVDIRVPEEYYLYYKQHGTCINCKQSLRHELHAFNHYKRWHLNNRTSRFSKSAGKSVRQRQRFYLLRWEEGAIVYKQVDLLQMLFAARQGVCTAMTKRR